MKRKLALVIFACLALCCTVFAACQTSVHTHELKKVDAKAATCETAGNTEYYYCEGCGKYFSDEQYNETTLENTVIAALGHDEESHDAKAATCTEDGWDAYVTCKRDGCDYTTKIVIPAAHTEVIDDAKAPTCTETGLTEGKHCSVCNEVIVAQQTVPALKHDIENHDGKPATCIEDGYAAYETCKREGCTYTTYKKIGALGHDEINHEKVDATCSKDGNEAYVTCSRCDYSTYKKINKLAHTGVLDKVVAATETEDGYTLFKCSACNDEYKVYTYYGVDSKVAVGQDMSKDTANNRVGGKGTLTYRVETSSAISVKLYVNVSSTGFIFSNGLDLTTVISSVNVNGVAVGGYSGLVPTGSDVYADYLIGEIDLAAGKTTIEVTVGEYSWAGPFFRGISLETCGALKLVEPFDGYVVKATANEVFVVGAYKDTANDRIYPNTGANAMGVTVGVKATKTATVDLYATVSGHGFDETVLLSRVISSLSVNGAAVTVEATALPKATDVYDNYKVATITLSEGDNVISLTSEHLAYFGPFFRGLMIASLDKIEFYNAVSTFGGYEDKVAVTEGMVKQPESLRVCGEGTMTYKINASKAGTAKLYVSISSMGAVFGNVANVNEVITAITVNGSAVTGYSDTIPAGADLYTGLYIGEITLLEGENVITVTDGKYSWAGPFFRSISLVGDATFTLLDANV